MLPSAPALTLAWPAGVVGLRILRGVVALLLGLALHGIEASGISFKRASSGPRLAAHYYGLC